MRTLAFCDPFIVLIKRGNTFLQSKSINHYLFSFAYVEIGIVKENL